MRQQAPGRICIFGEHQDYLNHPVIAGAIDLFFYVSGRARRDRRFVIIKRDLNETEEFSFPTDGFLAYSRPRDYFKSCLNVLKKNNVPISCGAEVEVWSEIPIAAGASSSSVLNVAWLRFLADLYQADFGNDQQRVAELAFQAEVSEFAEPGGKMDHYASALGGVHFLDFAHGQHVRLREKMDGFVLVDSLEKKDTLGMLQRIKEGENKALALIREKIPGRPLEQIDVSELGFLPPEVLPYGKAALLNFQLTLQGKELLALEPLNEELFGALLNRQQDILRTCLQNTTAKIELIHETAMKHGAWGGKMNGSGGGGTIFFYAGSRRERVIEALQELPVRVFPIKVV